MGVPSASQAQNITDAIAGRLKLDLAGFETEYANQTNLTIWDQVQAIGDPASEAYLGQVGYQLDRMSLPANHPANLSALVKRTGYHNFAAQFDQLVRAADGGGYSSFNAYLLDKAAVLHPAYAELARDVLGEGAFGTTPISTVFAPPYQTLAPIHCYAGADGSLTDYTTAAGNATTADITLWTANGNALYCQSKKPFSQLILGLSTVGSASISPLIEYYNGNGWAAVAGLIDNSTGFSKNQNVKWTVPADWTPSYLDKGGTAFPGGKERLYTLRIARQASSLTTPPVGTCISLIPIPVLNSSGLHLGIDQPPLALGRITGANTIVVEVLYAPDGARFKWPAISFRALTVFSANLTPTVSYTNQAGTSQTQAQSAWTAPAALATVAVALNGADTGVQAILSTNWSVSTTATDGVFAIYVPELRVPAV
jgi:hypothetical protein